MAREKSGKGNKKVMLKVIKAALLGRLRAKRMWNVTRERWEGVEIDMGEGE